MTRDEAINRIAEMIVSYKQEDEDDTSFNFDDEDIEALDMGISALSAEGEYIKKEDAIKAFEPYRGYLSRSNDTKFVEDLKNLPTVSFPDREKECIDPYDITHTFDNVTSLNGIAELNVRGKADE